MSLIRVKEKTEAMNNPETTTFHFSYESNTNQEPIKQENIELVSSNNNNNPLTGNSSAPINKSSPSAGAPGDDGHVHVTLTIKDREALTAELKNLQEEKQNEEDNEIIKAQAEARQAVNRATSPFAAEFEAILDPNIDNNPIQIIQTWDEAKADAFVEFVNVEELLTIIKKIDGVGSDTLSFDNISYKHNNIDYLHNISGVVHPNQITAVIGAPDAGVTLLLDILAGRIPKVGKVQGRVLFNGRDRTAQDTRKIGYVVKGDPNFSELTVYETLLFSASTRISNINPLAARIRTLITMKLLGLSHTYNTIVGDSITRGVSGGERRRVSYGCEFIAGSQVTIADLPTNGLDSTSAFNLINNIRKLVKAGQSLICSIVQPSPELFFLFDKILVLSKGRLIYQGPPNQVESFFNSKGFFRAEGKSLPDWIEEMSAAPEKFWTTLPQPSINNNPQDPTKQKDEGFLSQLLGNKHAEFVPAEKTHRGAAWLSLTEGYSSSEFNKTALKEVENSISNPGGKRIGGVKKEDQNPGRYALTFISQFITVLRRQGVMTFRNKSLWAQNINSAIVVGLILGSLFFNISRTQSDVRTRFGLFFFIIMNAAFGASQTIPVHFYQRSTFYNQMRNGYYHPAAYYFGANLIQIPVALIETFLITLIVYGMSNLYDGIGPYWLYMWLLVFLINAISRTYVMFLVSVSKNETVAQVLHPLTMLLFFTMCGFLAPKDSIPSGWSWIYYISYLTYGIRGLAVNEHQHADFVFTDCDNGCAYRDGAAALNIYDMNLSLDDRWYCIQCLVWFYIAFFAIGIVLYTFWDWISPEIDEPPNFRDAPIQIKRQASQASALGLKHKAFIEWSDLDYEVDVLDEKTNKTIPRKLLSKTFGFARPGLMVALMGASGAGKSTLLDVLARKKTAGRISGKILVNGIPQEPVSFSRTAAYVEQFDSHDEMCTVREAVEFSARLRLPTHYSSAELNKKIDNVLSALNISHLANERIGNAETGGVSPEVRKKCTIAVELIMEPSLLFLDEPTTGLDAPGALGVMTAVRDLASEIAVICTIHQPSVEIMNMFDYLLLMKEGGEIAYFGPLNELPTYFAWAKLGNYEPPANIGDFALFHIKRALSTGNDMTGTPINLASRYLESKWGMEVTNTLNEGIVPKDLKGKLVVPTEDQFASQLTQFIQLFIRFFKSTFRDTPGLGARLVTALLQSFVVGTLFINLSLSQTDASARVSISFMAVLMMVFSSTVKLPSLIAARAVYFREKGSNMYSVLSYFLGRLFGDIPYMCLEISIFSALAYFIPGLNLTDNGAHFGLFFLALFLIRFLGISYVTLAGGLVANPAAATAMFVLTHVVEMLFTGFLIPSGSIPRGWIWMYYLSHLRYPVNFIAANEIRLFDHFDCSASQRYNVSSHYAANTACNTGYLVNYNNGVYGKCPLQCGPELLDQFGLEYSYSDMYINIAVVAIFAIGFNFLSFLVTRNVNHIKR